MHCTCDGCSQMVLNVDEQQIEKPLCYFHAKQRDGLIPVEDREHYLSPSDMTALGQDSKRLKLWATIGLRYRPWVIKTAMKLALTHGVEAHDLIQEGLAYAWSLGSSVDMSKDMGQIVSYFKHRVRGRMIDYVAEIYTIFKISTRQYRQQKPQVISMEIHDDYMEDTCQSPEDMLIAKEERSDPAHVEKVYKFYESLTYPERIIFQQLMIAKKPKTTRQLATKLKFKSPQTVVNIRNKILKKAKEYFYASNDCKVRRDAGRSEENPCNQDDLSH